MSLLRRRPRRPAPARDPEATQPIERPVATEQAVYEETVPVEGRPPRVWPWLAALAILVLGGLVALYILSRDDDDGSSTTTTPTAVAPATVDVPNVVGERADRAAAQLIDVGLKVQIQRRLSKKPSGIVLEQDPAASTSAERGSTVGLVVSRGADTVAVPALNGLQLDEAVTKLQALGLKASTKRVDSDKPAGQVIAQEPGGGGELKKGEGVILTVSKGKAKVAVPDVVGQSRAEATAALGQAGFTVAVQQVPAADPEGTVVAQSPKAGDEAAKGAKVQINVSTGSSSTTTQTPATGTATVPDVVGLKRAAATNQLQAAGFKVDAREVPSGEPVGTVLAQFPAAGATAKRGGTIRINVSRGDGKKVVPDVVGLDEAAAQTRLESAGFTVTVVDQETTEPAEDGVVVDQKPPAEGRLKPGAEVTIFVGRLAG